MGYQPQSSEDIQQQVRSYPRISLFVPAVEKTGHRFFTRWGDKTSSAHRVSRTSKGSSIPFLPFFYTVICRNGRREDAGHVDTAYSQPTGSIMTYLRVYFTFFIVS